MEHHCKGEQLPGSADSATGTCATPPTAQGAVDLVCNGAPPTCPSMELQSEATPTCPPAEAEATPTCPPTEGPEATPTCPPTEGPGATSTCPPMDLQPEPIPTDPDLQSGATPSSSHVNPDLLLPRATSSNSTHSESRGSALDSSSSSSSELTHGSSRELLEQLALDLNSTTLAGEAVENNEVVKRLLEHVITLKLELEELKEENGKLRKIRTTMDDELHTLTENLFEEAYKMVDSAKEEKGLAVKKLADAAGKIDAMETEMSVLKNVLHATPPQITISKAASPHTKHRKPNVKKALRKLSRKVKSKSTVNCAESAGASPVTLMEHKSEVKGACLGEGQMDPNEFLAFNEWLSDVSQEDHPYLLKVLEQDILPCLDFSNKQLSAQVLAAVKENELMMESLSPPTEEKRLCALSGCDDTCCTHRMQLAPSQHWHYISQHCRDRIAAVCDFYMYIGHIVKGILKQDATLLYWQVNRLRALMNLARLCLTPD